MDFTDFKIGQDDEGRRLDKVLRILIPDAGLAQIYKSLRKGLIKLNQKKADLSVKLQNNDIINIADFLLKQEDEPSPVSLSQATVSLSGLTRQSSLPESSIVFQNEHFLIINKPQGMKVQQSNTDSPALNELVNQYYTGCKKNNSLSFKPGPLHRLDRMTSGIVCFSMSTKGAQWFSEQMKEHNIKKTYYAIIEGIIKEPQEWIDYIAQEESSDHRKNSFHTVKVYSQAQVEKGLAPDEAKISITKVSPLKSGKYDNSNLTFADIQIETGRHHQIRAQSAFHKSPLWGDTAYGGTKTNSNQGKFYLCAYKIQFPENELGLPQTIQIEPPLEFKKIIEKLED